MNVAHMKLIHYYTAKMYCDFENVLRKILDNICVILLKIE